jgi:uridylate kinase
MGEPKYKRILLKLSGEALAGERGYGVDANVVSYIAGEIRGMLALGIQVAVVLGGGNIWRGSPAIAEGMDAPQAHYAGMLATIINALALQMPLNAIGIFTRALTAIQMNEVAEPIFVAVRPDIWKRAVSSFWPVALATRISQRIQVRRFERLNSTPTLF